MFKLLISAILFSLISQRGLTQSTDSLNWIEINRNLKKGLQCYEELKASRQVTDSLKTELDSNKTAVNYLQVQMNELNNIKSLQSNMLAKCDSVITKNKSELQTQKINTEFEKDKKKKFQLMAVILGVINLLLLIVN